MGSTHSAILQQSQSSHKLPLHKIRRKTDNPVSWDDPRQVSDQAREIRMARQLATCMEDYMTATEIQVHANMLYFALPMCVPRPGHIYVAYSLDSLINDKITEGTIHDGETVVETMDMRRRNVFQWRALQGISQRHVTTWQLARSSFATSSPT